MSKTKNTLWLSAARVIGVIVQLISVPVVWGILGGELLGACYFLIFIVGRWVSLIDIGYNEGSQRLMTSAFDSGDKRTGFSVYQTHALLLMIHATVGFVIFALLGRLIVIPNLPNAATYSSLFIFGAFVFAAHYLYFNGFVYFNATRQFKYTAVANGTQFLVSSLLALGLTIRLETAEAYLTGFGTGYLLVYLFSITRGLLQAREVEGRTWFEKDAFKYSLRFGAKLYLTKVGSVAIGTFDRTVITDMLGPASLTHYTNAARYAETAGEAMPMNQTLLPDLTKAHAEGRKKFADLTERGSRIALMVGCGVILIPSSFGVPALQLWLQEKYVPEMAFVMLCMGAFRAIEAFYGSLVQAMFAHGCPQRVTVQTLVTAGLLVAFAYPAIKIGGISGAAALRAIVHLFLFLPIAWYVWRNVVPEISFGPWVRRLLGTLGIAVAFAGAGYWISSVPLIPAQSWMPLLLMPFMVAAYFYVVDKTGLAPVPDTIKDKLRKIFGKRVKHT